MDSIKAVSITFIIAFATGYLANSWLASPEVIIEENNEAERGGRKVKCNDNKHVGFVKLREVSKE